MGMEWFGKNDHRIPGTFTASDRGFVMLTPKPRSPTSRPCRTDCAPPPAEGGVEARRPAAGSAGWGGGPLHAFCYNLRSAGVCRRLPTLLAYVHALVWASTDTLHDHHALLYALPTCLHPPVVSNPCIDFAGLLRTLIHSCRRRSRHTRHMPGRTVHVHQRDPPRTFA